MNPTELRNALNKGVEQLKSTVGTDDQMIHFKGIYSNYYLYLEKDGFISLCADGYGPLLKANLKRSTQKIARLFYVDMTEKVCQ